MKQSKKISFRLVSYTDAAGRYSPGEFRSGNEDNFYVNCDLIGKSGSTSPDEVIQLGAYGMVMAVADGMGGANAGEVASQIAFDTISAAFGAGNLSDSIVQTVQSRQKYLEQIIKDTDKRIKSESIKDASKDGMGSTMIIAWLYGNELTISWCGDSRAYIFNEKTGIRLVSMDHTYVQELVNKGVLTYEQTFDHPQNNIITRSLGDPTKDAKPESKTVEVGKGDIILLCSDGLSGVLRDRKTYDSNGRLYPGDNLEDIIRANTDSMKKCREALWVAAENGGWYDNVTAILCQITDGPESQWISVSKSDGGGDNGGKNPRKMWVLIVCVILVLIMFLIGILVGRRIGGGGHPKTDSVIDTTFVNDTLLEDEVMIEGDAPASEEKAAEEEKKEVTPAEDKPSPETQISQQNETEEDTSSSATELTIVPQKDDETEQPKNELTPITKEQEEEPSLEDENPTENEPDSLTTD